MGETLPALAATGLVRRQGERFVVSDGLASILASGGLRAGRLSDGAWGTPGETLAGGLAQQLDGLDDRLHRPGAELLDAGAGPARVAVELCRRLPLARVVAIDLAAEGDLDDRIELRPGGLEALDDADRFDLAWLHPDRLGGHGCPTPEGPGLRALLRSLRVGGWAVLPARGAPGAGELTHAMEEAGFGSVRIVAEPLGGTPHFVAGRRTR